MTAEESLLVGSGETIAGSECDYDMGAVIHGEGVVTNLTYHL